MSRGMPSMTALLGLLALAGYQNRDKLSELLKGATGATGNNAQSGPGNEQSPLGGLLGNLGGALGGGGVGGLLGGGLGELLERFKQNGQGDAAESWINKGPNKRASSAAAETGNWRRCIDCAGAANWSVAGRTACETLTRASRRRGSIHARRSPSNLTLTNREILHGYSLDDHYWLCGGFDSEVHYAWR